MMPPKRIGQPIPPSAVLLDALGLLSSSVLPVLVGVLLSEVSVESALSVVVVPSGMALSVVLESVEVAVFAAPEFELLELDPLPVSVVGHSL